MATAAIASFATRLQPHHLPSNVLHAAQRSVYNYIGCAIGGATHPTTLKAARALKPFFGKPDCTVLGHQGQHGDSGDAVTRTDGQHAALLNGIASHVHDYDDTHLETIIHPSGPVASALLAAVQTPSLTTSPVSGEAFLTAFTAGVEVACKLGLAVWPAHYDIGWHITSTTGAIGAAVAVGKLLNLTELQMRHAIGVAATQVVGLREMFGSDTKSFHPGRAAQAGLLAAVLAKEGWTSSDGGIEAKRGWAAVVSKQERLSEVVVKGLARLGLGDEGRGEKGREYEWEILKNAFKPFPCGIVCHPAIDACVQLRAELSQQAILDPESSSFSADLAEKLERIDLRAHPLVLELTAKKTPRDGLEAKFSVFHGCAVGLLYGRAGPAQYADDVVNDTAVIGIRDKISAEAPEQGSTPAVAADAAIATMYLGAAGNLEKRVDHAVGSLVHPMNDEQLKDKFVDQCALVVGENMARHASEIAWGLVGVEDVGKAVLDGL